MLRVSDKLQGVVARAVGILGVESDMNGMTTTRYVFCEPGANRAFPSSVRFGAAMHRLTRFLAFRA
jgi:hypothetical protein